MDSFIKKFISISMALCVGLFSLQIIPITNAYFSDTETSLGNTFQAGTLDFSLSSGSDFSPNVTPTQSTSRTIGLTNAGTLGFQYTLNATNFTGDTALCNALVLDADVDGGSLEYSGNLTSISTTSPITFSSPDDWTMAVFLAGSDPSLENKTCSFDFVFSGEQIGGAGFSDREVISNTVTSGSSIVLNEFLPNPDGIFGDDGDSKPLGEWVELYNKGTSAINVSGWQIKDAGPNHTITISASNTNTGSTTIAAGGWLVVYMDHEVLNNTGGDTVSLYGASGVLADSHSYDTSSYCSLTPTPGVINVNDPLGSCSTVPGNKSYARIPDGTGAWIDPIPTPGMPNILTEEEIILEIPAEVVLVPDVAMTQETTPEVAVTTPSTTPDVIVTEEVIGDEILESINNNQGDAITDEVITEEAPAAEEEVIVEETATEEIPATEEVIVTDETQDQSQDEVVIEDASEEDTAEITVEPVIITTEETAVVTDTTTNSDGEVTNNE